MMINDDDLFANYHFIKTLLEDFYEQRLNQM